jgi:hypothetical protein
MAYGLDYRVSISGRVKTGSGAHPASCPRGSRGVFPGGKSFWECSWPPPPTAEVKYGGAIPPLPHMASWHIHLFTLLIMFLMKQHFLIYWRLKQDIIYFLRIPKTYCDTPLLISTRVHECLAPTPREGKGEKARVWAAAASSYPVGRDTLVTEARQEDCNRISCRVERMRGQASNRWKELRNAEKKRNEKRREDRRK